MATDYWRKREKKWLDECKKEEKNFEKDISDIYDQMEAEIIEQIDTWINKYADANGMSMAQAKEYLSKTDIEWYARRAKYYCELAAQDMEANNKDHAAIYFSDQANAEMARYNATMKINRFDMIRSQIKLRVLKAQSNVAGSMEADLIKRAMEEYTRQAGILGDSVLDNAANAEIIARASFHGATFSERIWGAHQETLIKTLNKALSEGLILGKGVRPLTSQIAKATGVAMKKAATLLGTELCRVQIDVQKDCYKSSGFNQFTFIASPGCCPHCQENNGKHFDVRNMMSGDTAPPMHPHCRCSTAAYMERKDDEISDDKAVLFDRWSETFEEHGLSWEEYKKKEQGKVVTEPKNDKFPAYSPKNFSKLITDLTKYQNALIDGTECDEELGNYQLSEYNRLKSDPKVKITDVLRTKIEKLEDLIKKEKAVSYFRNEAGIEFVDAKSKQNKVDAEYISQCADWHKDFVNRFSKFNNSKKYVHLPLLQIETSKFLGRNVLGHFASTSRNRGPYLPDEISLLGSHVSSFKAVKESQAREADISQPRAVDNQMVRGYRWSSGANPVHTFIHEYGHYIGCCLDQLNGKGWQEKFIQECIEEFNEQTGNSISGAGGLQKVLSLYGSYSAREAFAEAFSEYFGEEKPWAFALIFGTKLEQELLRQEENL